MTMPQETDPFWIGQKKINGNLCRVDWRIIQALLAVRDILRGIPGVNAAAVDSLDKLIQDADQLGEKVAGDDPPGCGLPQRNH